MVEMLYNFFKVDIFVQYKFFARLNNVYFKSVDSIAKKCMYKTYVYILIAFKSRFPIKYFIGKADYKIKISDFFSHSRNLSQDIRLLKVCKINL